MATIRVHPDPVGNRDGEKSEIISTRVLTEAISQTLRSIDHDLEPCEDSESSQETAVSITFDGLCGYSIDPQRLSFERSSEISPSQGAFGDVKRGTLLCQDKATCSTIPVAVKALRVGDNISPSTLQRRLTREAFVLSQISHKNIVEFLGFCYADEPLSAWLVYPWMPYGDSHSYVEYGAPGIEDRLRLLIDAAEGLAYLHSHQPAVIHGDVKAANFLLNDRLEGKLCDFGLASLIEDQTFKRLMLSEFQGTARWCSPEVLLGFRGIEGDVWAWAWLAWEIMTGTFPYPYILSEVEVIARIALDQAKPDLSSTNIPKSLRSVMERCWERDPGERMSISEVLNALRSLASCTGACVSCQSDVSDTTLTNSPAHSRVDQPNTVASTPDSCFPGEGTYLTASIPSDRPRRDLDGSHPGGFTDRHRMLGVILRSCCCLCGGRRRREPRALVKGPDDPDDFADALAVEAILAEEPILEPMDVNVTGNVDPEIDHPQSSSCLPPPAENEQRYGRSGTLLQFERGSDTFVAKPLSIPWRSRILNTGTSLPEGVSPEHLLDRQIKNWKVLNHPRIHPVRGYTIINGTPHIVTPRCDNGNLQDYIDRGSDNVNMLDRITKVRQIAEGLAYLHRQEPPVVHSNLKMENILLDENETPVVTDIGIFAFLNDHQLSTYGCPEDIRRVAPELWLGGKFTTASDAYSFGCLALEILTGRRIYCNIVHLAEVVLAVQRGESPSLNDYPELAGETTLWAMLKALWDRNPERRLTMQQVVLELEKRAQPMQVLQPSIYQYVDFTYLPNDPDGRFARHSTTLPPLHSYPGGSFLRFDNLRQNSFDPARSNPNQRPPMAGGPSRKGRGRQFKSAPDGSMEGDDIDGSGEEDYEDMQPGHEEQQPPPFPRHDEANATAQTPLHTTDRSQSPEDHNSFHAYLMMESLPGGWHPAIASSAFQATLDAGASSPASSPAITLASADSSSTSRKALPPSVTPMFHPSPRGEKRSWLQAGLPTRAEFEGLDHDGQKQDTGDNESTDDDTRALQDHVEQKRRANTIAARKSRRRKVEFIEGLQVQVQTVSSERDVLRDENAEMKQKINQLRLQLQHVPLPLDFDDKAQEAALTLAPEDGATSSTKLKPPVAMPSSLNGTSNDQGYQQSGSTFTSPP